MELIKLINLDKKIKKIYEYLVEILRQKGLYDNSLDVQILNVSSQIFQFQKLTNALVQMDVTPVRTENSYKYQRNPITSDLVNLSESLRKNLKELGLSLNSDIKGMATNDPLANLINEMNNIE